MDNFLNNVEYEEKIREISIDKIEVNDFNPRKKFVESEEDELIESIVSKGILNPIIVYKKRSSGKYVILDGERRYRASLKLNKQKIPAHILKHEPETLENLSMMFHIHNVREEWTDFAIAISLQRVIQEMGRDVKNLNREDIIELTKISSLSEYKVKKYLSFLQYPKEVITRFLDSEKQEKPEKGVDPDILMEMHRPIKNIKEIFPEFLEEYPVPKIIEACIKKKANNTIKNNREFRLLSKALLATKRGNVRKELMYDKLIDFINNTKTSPEKVFTETSEAIYLLKQIITGTETLGSGILNLDLRRLTQDEKEHLRESIVELISIINNKILR